MKNISRVRNEKFLCDSVHSHSDSLFSEDESVKLLLLLFADRFASYPSVDSAIALCYPSLTAFLCLNSFKHYLYNASPFSTNLAFNADKSVRSCAISL